MALVARGRVLAVQPFDGGNKRVIVAGTGRVNDLLMLGPDVVAEVGKDVEAPVRAGIDRDPETGVQGIIFWGLGWVSKKARAERAGAHA